ncbi:MAG: Flp family type IVb pilin [Candidatus Dormibacteraceae bacterium]
MTETVVFPASGPSPGARSWRLRTGRGQTGQGMVEYALILILVSIVGIVLIISVGGQINKLLSNVVAVLGS